MPFGALPSFPVSLLPWSIHKHKTSITIQKKDMRKPLEGTLVFQLKDISRQVCTCSEEIFFNCIIHMVTCSSLPVYKWYSKQGTLYSCSPGARYISLPGCCFLHWLLVSDLFLNTVTLFDFDSVPFLDLWLQGILLAQKDFLLIPTSGLKFRIHFLLNSETFMAWSKSMWLL